MPRLGAQWRAAIWLFAIALGPLGGCTDPVFVPASDASVPEDSSQPSDRERHESPDTGAEPLDTGAEPPQTRECEGGACPARDADTPGTAPEGGASDAGPMTEEDGAALDEVRAKWAGRYAARSAMFTYDDPAKGSARLLSVVEIVPTPEGGLRLEEELCYFEGGWNFLITGVLKYEYVAARGSAALQFDSDDFESEQISMQIGYGSTPAGCTPGATMMKGEEQTWLTTTTCDCPRSADPPTSPRDCRVTDPEKDNEPGATFRAAIDSSPLVFRVTQEERVRLLNGYRRNDRLYAERWFQDTTRILNCTINGTLTAAASCPIGAAKTCPSRHNKVEMVSIEDPIQCADVIAKEHSLFLAPLQNFPDACPSEIASASRP